MNAMIAGPELSNPQASRLCFGKASLGSGARDCDRTRRHRAQVKSFVRYVEKTTDAKRQRMLRRGGLERQALAARTLTGVCSVGRIKTTVNLCRNAESALPK